MHWIYLTIAILSEVIATSSLKAADGFTRWAPSLIVVIGYLLMIGGGSEDPNKFDANEIFSFRRITLSPIVILTGFVVVLFGIMKKAKD